MELKKDWNPNRYNQIDDKCPREIVMLRGKGCSWRKCNFCDYHLDSSTNIEENYQINKNTLDKVTGIYHKLEVINSGSFSELDDQTIKYIKKICNEKNIDTLYIEAHYRYKEQISSIKKNLEPLKVYIKLGIETFDIDFRENFFNKGMGNALPQEIAKYFDDCCLLFGVKGQTREMINNDIKISSRYFNRICINIFTPNLTNAKIDEDLVKWFIEEWYPKLKDDNRFDILLDNSAFGVGGVCTK